MSQSRLSLKERIECVRLYSLYGKPCKVRAVWAKKFPGQQPPSAKTILSVNRKFDQTGSVMDLEKSGRPKTATSKENCVLVKDALRNRGSKTLKEVAENVGITKSSVHRINKELKKEEVENSGKIENQDNHHESLQPVTVDESVLTSSGIKMPVGSNESEPDAANCSNITFSAFDNGQIQEFQLPASDDLYTWLLGPVNDVQGFILETETQPSL